MYKVAVSELGLGQPSTFLSPRLSSALEIPQASAITTRGAFDRHQPATNHHLHCHSLKMSRNGPMLYRKRAYGRHSYPPKRALKIHDIFFEVKQPGPSCTYGGIV